MTHNLERFILFPIQYENLYNFYLKAVASFWTTAEVNLQQDKSQFDALTKNEQSFILSVLSFFATSDQVVNENLAKNFSTEINIPEATQFYNFQIGVEAIHTQMYGELILFYESNMEERNKLFRSVINNPCIRQKTEWALKYTAKDVDFSSRLIAFACVEGIFFSASFCAIFYFKKRGLLPGLTFSNELISRDEGLHRDFACELYNSHCEKLDDLKVFEIVQAAVEAEKIFVKDALPVNIIGLNAELMMQYIEFVADHLLNSLGHPKCFNTVNPFEWMELISLPGKTNFFEKRVGEYAKAGVGDNERNVFQTIEDF